MNFPYLDRDVPRRASYGVYISQLIRFARVSSHVTDFNIQNKLLTANLQNQGYRYHELRKATIVALSSAVVYTRICSVRVLTHQCNISENMKINGIQRRNNDEDSTAINN